MRGILNLVMQPRLWKEAARQLVLSNTHAPFNGQQ